MDPILADVVLGKGENHVVEMKWDELTSRVQMKMSDGFSLQFPGQPTEYHKGKLDPIELTTATRSGNKKITLIYNLETYRIDPQQFAHKCQVGVAASTAVNPAVNRKTGSEVMIQGNQVAFATRLLLEEYKIPRKYIKGTENAVKKKK
ncbi:eukaryotic translation initiation factor 2D [Eurytemora carolleeae]|uniref:eukaryotic translation initiation factor 2D n=1 Tax=Eurytemora carolleeae TaxID=1294199 RepID=UPI000C76361D|nr:eukaryotic translation initiation factor 2D [Eurytemora carolleeae]|eukprot:XP_023334067.1 eukaryotic translation initiation factor 2D-like [Eurytemora affinis]